MNVFKFAHVVVATLYNRVDMRDELEIRVKRDAQDIYREDGCKVFAMTLIAYEQFNQVLSGFSSNLFLYIQSLGLGSFDDLR